MPLHPPSTIHDPRRLLVRGVNWLGDAVMTTPALMRLRERFPEAHISLLTPHKLADLWRDHRAVDDTIFFTPDETLWSVSRRLRAGNFDQALILPNSPRSALEVWLARIPRRVGLARPWRNWFLTTRLAPRSGAVKMRKLSVGDINRRNTIPAPDSTRPSLPAAAHQIHEYLHLAAALGANPEPQGPRLFLAPDEIEAARRKFGLTDTARPVLGLNPGAEYGPAKRWPLDRFAAAAREVHQRTGCIWLVLGGKGDAGLAERLTAELGPPDSDFRNLAGRTSLRELMALLGVCRVLLTNDSGPMHVAAALGTPVVALFGSTSPELTGPGLPGDPRHRLLRSGAGCSPCFLRECPIDFRCMNGIRVEQVVNVVGETLRRQP